MWRIIRDYETENDIPTIKDEDSYYYGNLDDDERARLDEIKTPSRTVSFLMIYVDDQMRTIERDIAEMRRIVVKFMNVEE